MDIKLCLFSRAFFVQGVQGDILIDLGHPNLFRVYRMFTPAMCVQGKEGVDRY